MSEIPPDVSIHPLRKTFLSGASVVWIIPLLALVIALGVAWKSYSDRGPEIRIDFKTGAGITAGETELRYRDVTVGRVEKVGFTEDLSRVVATVRVDKDVGPFIDAGAVFWIVEPKVTAQGITGLSTVLSGIYIEGSWDNQIGPAADTFQGSDKTPLIRPGDSGLQIAFRTTANGQLTDNAPILFRGIEVGKVGTAQISPLGNYAIVEAVIYEDNRDLVNTSSRFWETSGFDVKIGPAGAEIDFSSLATLVGGGITFDTFVSGGERVPDGTVFEIFPDKENARSSVFNASSVDPLLISVVFEENVSGLTVGAPVELSGLKIGEVQTLSGVVDYDQFGDSRVRLNATLSIQPARLGLPDEVTAESALGFLQNRVSNGLRARLASASLLTGGLKVELVDVEDADTARMDSLAEGVLPVMPTTQSNTSDAAATVEGVFTRINNLPIEELLNSAINFLNSADVLVRDEDLRKTPQDVRTLLNDLSGLVNSDGVQNVPVALNATLVSIERMVAQLEEERIISQLNGVLTAAEEAAKSVSSSVEGVPQLVAQIEAVAKKAGELELQELVDELAALTRSAEAVIGTDDAIALPGALKGALDELNASLKELREGGAVDNVNRTLASARNAADNIAVSAQDLPRIVERLTGVLTQASQTIQGYNKGDEISRSTQDTLRNISKAADALAKLARTIERNPNSLLLGR